MRRVTSSEVTWYSEDLGVYLFEDVLGQASAQLIRHIGGAVVVKNTASAWRRKDGAWRQPQACPVAGL